MPSTARKRVLSRLPDYAGLRIGQTGKRGRSHLTDRPARPPRHIVPTTRGGAKGRLHLIRSLCSSLILYGAIRTTLGRAKGLQRRMAAYIRWAKVDSPRTREKARENLVVRALRAAAGRR
jgi:hypothetical protein